MDYQVLIRAYETPQDHRSVRRFRRACEELHLPFRLIKTFGGSDASNLFHHGVPGLVLASAMELVHSCQEYTSVPELVRLTEIVKWMVQDAE